MGGKSWRLCSGPGQAKALRYYVIRCNLSAIKKSVPAWAGEIMIGGQSLESVTPADEDRQARSYSVTLADVLAFMSNDTVACDLQPEHM